MILQKESDTLKTVKSNDGTAYNRSDSGPALTLVDGAIRHRGFGPTPGLAKRTAVGGKESSVVATGHEGARGRLSNARYATLPAQRHMVQGPVLPLALVEFFVNGSGSDSANG